MFLNWKEKCNKLTWAIWLISSDAKTSNDFAYIIPEMIIIFNSLKSIASKRLLLVVHNSTASLTHFKELQTWLKSKILISFKLVWIYCISTKTRSIHDILLTLKHIALALKQQITLLFLYKFTPKNTDLCCSSLPSTSWSKSFQDPVIY